MNGEPDWKPIFRLFVECDDAGDNFYPGGWGGYLCGESAPVLGNFTPHEIGQSLSHFEACRKEVVV